MKKRMTTTDVNNVITEHFLFDRFKLLALNQYKWDGLPDTIQERHIERVLFDEGKAFFFVDKELGPLCLPCFQQGVNVYGDPVRWTVTGFNYRKTIDAADGVLIENNKLWLPTQRAVFYFVNQLYEVLRTRDTNIKTLKLPFFVKTDSNTELTIKKMLEKVEDNEWALFVDKNAGLENAIEVLQTGVKCLTTELTDTYHDILNEALTYMGINNANTDKRERLITSEADANNQLIDSCAEIFLESRKRACEQIKNKFGINVNVELRTARVEVEKGDKDNESKND